MIFQSYLLDLDSQQYHLTIDDHAIQSLYNYHHRLLGLIASMHVDIQMCVYESSSIYCYMNRDAIECEHIRLVDQDMKIMLLQSMIEIVV
jgi:hypothetical protein